MNNLQVHYDMADETSRSSFIPYLPSIIMQRKWLVIIPTLLALIAAIAAAFLLPTRYQSRAVLLVEAPLLAGEVALDMTGAQVVDQRIARIRQQVLSRPQLIELIQRNGLYQTELSTSSLSEVISKMRSDIEIAPVRADIQSGARGQRSTIAFGMSFSYSDPVKAQAVAQALTERVLQIDSSKTAQQVVSTVQFLSDQEAELAAQIQQLSSQITDVKARNGLSFVNNVGGSGLGSLDGQIAALQASNMQLNAQRDMTQTAAERDPIVAQAEQNLALARSKYSERHPDVVLAKQRLEEARELGKVNQQRIPMDRVEAQIAFNNRQLAALQAARAAEMERQMAIAGAQARAPMVQQEISQLQERLNILNTNYQRVSNQLMAAKAGQKAEDEQQGERLSVIDPAAIPDEPVSPNRPMIIAMVTGAGLALGLGLILLIELVMKPIRDAGAVALATGEAPLVVIPTILSKGERQRKGWKALWPFGGSDDDDDEDEDDEPKKKKK
ncbi:conserved hypothetical protein [Sphingobium sp. SYK-6]|uniref:GumC family protein n=1 Tax=Sphingobium sp. (strain NBRC 103272 / SYK-6) TaxID=627192 RepID=UPI00022779ED|nr:GNVR domain-containing protein [Sphingobium sp. SYK-6]BAK68089.1 conserved hypothetical protein [Sphingobium sp. SYK-6]